jgi:hypothetical protein
MFIKYEIKESVYVFSSACTPGDISSWNLAFVVVSERYCLSVLHIVMNACSGEQDKDQSLLAAAAAGNLPAVKELLKHGAGLSMATCTDQVCLIATPK